MYCFQEVDNHIENSANNYVNDENVLISAAAAGAVTPVNTNDNHLHKKNNANNCNGSSAASDAMCDASIPKLD